MQRFGGAWTETKLRIVREYLTSYLTAMKKQKFELYYIDAFAGSGYRATKKLDDDRQTQLAFDAAFDGDAEQFIQGSAIQVLQLNQFFHGYVFIEMSTKKITRLREHLDTDFKHLSSRVQVITGNANEEILRICRAWPVNRRAVMFLDPFGMQIEWATLQAIAKTQRIDLWWLFPLSVGILRLLKRNGQIPADWAARVDSTLGTLEWRERFFAPKAQGNLFSDFEDVAGAERVVNYDGVLRFFIERLGTIFAGVADSPRILTNSTKSPLFALCFAVGNPNGSALALRMANHLLVNING